MVADPVFFRDFAYVFVAAVLGGALAWVARQPLILGYVVGGILVGPFTPGPAVSDIHTFELLAEIGVILLMFSIGIEFSLRDLLRVKWVALAGAPLGILLSVGAGVATGRLMGWSVLQGIVVGIVVSVASTMVLARLLLDQGALHSRHGRVMIGITLVEDLAVVVLTVLLPALGSLEPGRALAIASAIGRAALILVPFAYLAAKVVPSLMTRVARTRNEELFLLVVLALGLGTAALTQAVGLSLALGAFLAGLLISNSDYAHETLARLLPLRDAFVALFFVTVGALIDPSQVLANLPLLAVMLALIVLAKLAIWTAVVLLFRYPLSTALLVGVGLTQIGEFSFILVQVARAAGHVGAELYNATLAASLLSILVNAALVRAAPAWIGALALSRDRLATVPGPADAQPRIIICGFGRVGSAVGEALDTFGVRYSVIERDPDVVRALRGRGVTCVFGNAARREILQHVGADEARLVILALPDAEAARLAVGAIRAGNPRVPVLARAHRASEADGLRQIGVTEVIQPEVEASAALIKRALRALNLPEESATAYGDRFREAVEMAQGERVPGQQPLPEVREVRLPAGALADQSLREAQIRERFGVTVVAIDRAAGGVMLHPPPETVLRSGDRLRVFGLPEQIEAFASEAQRQD
jgi:CPA2 family monovalent cation:H+ antiporter-2